MKCFKSILSYSITILSVIFISIYLISIVQIKGSYMEPLINDDDVLFLSKFHYKVFDIKVGDIVMVKTKEFGNQIKKVVALPGEEIKIEDQTVFSSIEITTQIIPDDTYLLENNNELNTNIELINIDDIIGKCLFTFWPLKNIGFL